MTEFSQPDFQQRVGRFVAEHGLETSAETRLLDLVSEWGEVAKEILRGNR